MRKGQKMEELSEEETAEWKELIEQRRRRLGRPPAGNVKRLSVTTLARVRNDDHYEEHHGINEVRACRICGMCLGRLGPPHVAYLVDKHEPMSSQQYRDYCRQQGWGMPPVASVLKLKQVRDRNEAQKKRDPDGFKLQVSQTYRKQRDRIHTDKEYRERYNALARGRIFRQRRAKGRELISCLESPCHEQGLQFEFLDPHLASMHNILWRQYERKHPGAPRGTPKQLEDRGAHLVEMRKKYAQKLGAAHAAQQSRPAPKSPGAPRKDAIAQRVEELKSAGKSWTQVTQIINREKGLTNTVSAYRSLVIRRKR